MKLTKFADILNKEFGPPFLPDGFVRAIWEPGNTLRVYIGRRDIHIDEEGHVLGAGTCLSKPVAETCGHEKRQNDPRT